MDMIRQDNDCVDRERPLVPHFPEYVAQMIDLEFVIEDRMPFVRYYGEEV
jgi:hypothetical protein